MSIKNCIVALLLLSGATVMQAQMVKLKINEGLPKDSQLKNAIEKNASALLTEINRAQSIGTDPDFHGISITEDVQKDIHRQWSQIPFFCDNSLIVEPVIQKSGGYEIRNIPCQLTPEDNKEDDDVYQYAIIEFDKTGVITRFDFTFDDHQYLQIVENGKKVGDMARREIIINAVEQLKTAYIRKDMDFIEKIYKDNALIITGNVITIDRSSVVTFMSQTKKEYLKGLDRVFKTYRFINIEFDSIQVSIDKRIPNYYLVQCTQHWKSGRRVPGDGYKDVGVLSLVFDFTDENSPRINVRVWEPLGFYANGVRNFHLPDLKLSDIK